MKWKWMLVFAVAWFGLGFAGQPALAENNMDIEVNLPLGGIVKYESWVRLGVTITSQETDISGFVELSRKPLSKNLRQSNFRRPVKLEQGKSTTLFFDLPMQILLDNWYVHVTQNGQVLKSEKLRLPYPKDGQTIGVVDEGGNAFHFLAVNASQSKMNRPISVQNLTPDMLPDQSWMYESLDVLAISGKQGALIDDAQLAAIKEWIKLGGVVILSAGPGQDGLVQRFADILPIQAGQKGSVPLAEALRTYAGDKPAPPGKLGVYNKEMPLYVAKKSGQGVFLFVNYDVTAEPLASWQHNLPLWQNVMVQQGVTTVLENKRYFDQMSRSLLELSKKIPDVQTPPPVWMVVMWGGYVLLVAPLAYFVLKKAGRQEWAWGIIPGAAILLTVGIFAIGKPLVVKTNVSYTISEISVLDEKLAKVRTGTTFLAVDKDGYDVIVEPSIVAVPLTQGRNDYEPEGITDGSRLLSYRNLPYLTPKQAIGFGVMHDIGAFEVDVHVEENRLVGQVKNNTVYSYEQSFLEVGLQRIPIGALKKGEEKQIDAVLESLFMPRDQQQDEQDSPEKRRKEMQENIIGYAQGGQVRLIGITTEPVPLMKMQEPHQAHYWNVVNQTVQLQPQAEGDVILPYGLLNAELFEASGDYESNSGYLWQLGKGSITFELRTDATNLELKRLLVPLDHSSYRPFRIEYFHQKSGKWRTVEHGTKLVLEQELQDALTANRTLLLRFSNSTVSRLSLPTPFFQVEGVRKW
ncbi:hypothetical protein ACEF06_09800 [Brevibacillus agri]